MASDIGLYIHIPFCKAKCNYCDFNSYQGMNHLIPDYMEALKKELELYAKKMRHNRVVTVFIGGGTPSFLDEEHINGLIETMLDNYSCCSNMEISIETNPGTLTFSKLCSYREYGINRLSIGLQAWQNKLLQSMGRIHNLKEFVQNYNDARKCNFRNINIDIMFGLPGQTMDDFTETVENIVKMKPEHISCYSLIIEEETKLCEMVNKHLVEPVSDELDRQMYHYAIDTFKKYGYMHYEISNFALPEHECRHNTIYWKAREYLGVGAGAHSYLFDKRFCNVTDPSDYIKKINSLGIAVCEENYIDQSESMKEYIILGLRLVDGINASDFEKRYGKNFFELYGNKVEYLINKELLEGSGDNIRLTSKGLDLANKVFIEFI